MRKTITSLLRHRPDCLLAIWMAIGANTDDHVRDPPEDRIYVRSREAIAARDSDLEPLAGVGQRARGIKSCPCAPSRFLTRLTQSSISALPRGASFHAGSAMLRGLGAERAILREPIELLHSYARCCHQDNDKQRGQAEQHRNIRQPDTGT